MATSSCANCIYLTKQCLELKEEVANLTLKLDRLYTAVFFDKKNGACQSDPSLTTCKTEIDISTQTLSPSPCNQLESNTLTDKINLSKNITTQTNEQLFKSAFDVSSTSIHEGVLMDIFMSSSEPVSNVTSVPQKKICYSSCNASLHQFP